MVSYPDYATRDGGPHYPPRKMRFAKDGLKGGRWTCFGCFGWTGGLTGVMGWVIGHLLRGRDWALAETANLGATKIWCPAGCELVLPSG